VNSSPFDLVFVFVFFAVWLVFGGSLVVMIIVALKDRNQSGLSRFLGGSFLLEPYNRRYFRIFLAAFASLMCLAAIYNILFATGQIG
jgi:hypothetical protein